MSSVSSPTGGSTLAIPVPVPVPVPVPAAAAAAASATASASATATAHTRTSKKEWEKVIIQVGGVALPDDDDDDETVAWPSGAFDNSSFEDFIVATKPDGDETVEAVFDFANEIVVGARSVIDKLVKQRMKDPNALITQDKITRDFEKLYKDNSVIQSFCTNAQRADMSEECSTWTNLFFNDAFIKSGLTGAPTDLIPPVVAVSVKTEKK